MARNTYIYELRAQGVTVGHYTVKREALQESRNHPTWDLYRCRDGVAEGITWVTCDHDPRGADTE